MSLSTKTDPGDAPRPLPFKALPATESPMSPESTSLEKPAETALTAPRYITTPEEYQASMRRWTEHKFHILTPFTNISGLAPGFVLLPTTVTISIDKAEQEIYDNGKDPTRNKQGLPWLADGEVALAKRGLRKISSATGISWRTDRLDPYTIASYWHIKAICSYRGIDGTVIIRDADQEWDLRDGSDRVKGFGEAQKSEARKNGLRNCQSRAVNAAIRECGTGLKQKYSKEELRRPFVGIQVMYVPDMTDAATRRLVTERALGGTAAMYPPIEVRSLPGEVIDVEADEPAKGTVGEPKAVETPAEASRVDPAPSSDAVKIAKVEVVEGTTNGKAWKRWDVVDSSGVVYSTFSRSFGEVAEKFQKSQAWVDVVGEQNGPHYNISEIGPAQPSLLPDPGDL